MSATKNATTASRCHHRFSSSKRFRVSLHGNRNAIALVMYLPIHAHLCTADKPIGSVAIFQCPGQATAPVVAALAVAHRPVFDCTHYRVQQPTGSVSWPCHSRRCWMSEARVFTSSQETPGPLLKKVGTDRPEPPNRGGVSVNLVNSYSDREAMRVLGRKSHTARNDKETGADS